MALSRPTAIVSHGEIDANPLEQYGEAGEVLLRIGYVRLWSDSDFFPPSPRSAT